MARSEIDYGGAGLGPAAPKYRYLSSMQAATISRAA